MLLEDLPDEPHVPERVHHCALQHAPDGVRPRRGMRVFFHWTSENGAHGQRLALHGFRIVDEEFDADGREPSSDRTACAVRG